jgi:hypothetical protein
MTRTERRLNAAWWALRIGLGVGPLLTGLDKFFNILTMWSMYLSPLAERLLPVSDAVFMRAVGVVEMIVGLAILTRWTRAGAYVLSIWLLAIVANLAASGNFWDLAMRDVEIALAAFVLARMTEWRAAVIARETVPASAVTAPEGVRANA